MNIIQLVKNATFKRIGMMVIAALLVPIVLFFLTVAFELMSAADTTSVYVGYVLVIVVIGIVIGAGVLLINSFLNNVQTNPSKGDTNA